MLKAIVRNRASEIFHQLKLNNARKRKTTFSVDTYIFNRCCHLNHAFRRIFDDQRQPTRKILLKVYLEQFNQRRNQNLSLINHVCYTETLVLRDLLILVGTWNFEKLFLRGDCLQKIVGRIRAAKISRDDVTRFCEEVFTNIC